MPFRRLGEPFRGLNNPVGVAGGKSILGDLIDIIGRSNIVEIWPLTANANGIVNGYNGTPSNVSFGGNSGALFNGLSSYINAYSAALAAAYNPTELTVIQFIKPNGNIWATSPNRRTISFLTNGTNYFFFRLQDASNDLVGNRTSNGVADKNAAMGFSSSVAWQMAMLTVSQTGNQVRLFRNKTEIGAAAAATAWSASGLNSTNTCIGSANTTPSESWDGWLAWTILCKSALSPAVGGKIYDLLFPTLV